MVAFVHQPPVDPGFQVGWLLGGGAKEDYGINLAGLAGLLGWLGWVTCFPTSAARPAVLFYEIADSSITRQRDFWRIAFCFLCVLFCAITSWEGWEGTSQAIEARSMLPITSGKGKIDSVI